MRTSRNVADPKDKVRSGNALTETQAADHLGLSIATLRAWRHRGKGPRFVRFGRAVRYLRADLDAFIRACSVDTQSVSASDGASSPGELSV
jgi:excisionase family DNA binding protein